MPIRSSRPGRHLLSALALASMLSACSHLPGIAENRPRIPNPCTVMPRDAITRLIGPPGPANYTDNRKDFLERRCSWSADTASYSDSNLTITITNPSAPISNVTTSRSGALRGQGATVIDVDDLGDRAIVVIDPDGPTDGYAKYARGPLAIEISAFLRDGSELTADQLIAAARAFNAALPADCCPKPMPR